MSKNRFLKNTFILTCTGFLTRLMGFFYRIFLSRTIGAQGLGLYQLITPLEMLVLALTSSGIQASISRICASKLALNDKKGAKDIFLTGTGLALILSGCTALFCFRNAPFLAEQLIKEPDVCPMIRLFSFSIPLSVLHNCIKSYYFALKCTEIPAGIQLLEQLVRISSCYLFYLILLSEGETVTPLIATGGALAGETAAVLVSLIAINIRLIYRQKISFLPLRVRNSLGEICTMAFPFTLNRVLISLLGSMEMYLIPQMLILSGLSRSDSLSIYGIFTGMAMPLILFPATFTNSLSAMLMPSIAEFSALGNFRKIRNAITQTCYCCFFLGTLCMLGFFLFGRFAGMLLFHSITAGTYIRTLAFICPFLYLNTALSGILHGLGKAGRYLIHSLASVGIRILSVIILVPFTGIRGYFYGIFFSELLLSVLHLAALYTCPFTK